MSQSLKRAPYSPFVDAAITFAVTYSLTVVAVEGFLYVAGIRESVVLSVLGMIGPALIAHHRYVMASGHLPNLAHILKLSGWSTLVTLFIAVIWLAGYSWIFDVAPFGDLHARLEASGNAGTILAIIIPVTVAIFVAMYALVYGVIGRLVHNVLNPD